MVVTPGLTRASFYSYWGLAELSAYVAYNDSIRLNNAKTNWDIAYTDFITTDAAQSHSYPRNTNTTTDCGCECSGGPYVSSS